MKMRPVKGFGHIKNHCNHLNANWFLNLLDVSKNLSNVNLS